MHGVRRVVGFACATVAALAGGVAGASASEYAPLDAAGPELSVPLPELRRSLECTDDVRDATRAPVLLLSGTTVDPDENFAWNYMPALTRAGIPWCASTAPDDNMADIQVRGEYVVFAIRRMHRLAGRPIAIFGHSQGGMVGRWALRFWPDTRWMVDDVVGAAPSNHGTDSALTVCALACAPSIWQQRTGADFIRALNSRTQTFPGLSYTNVYTHLDLIVFPNLDDNGRSSLHGPGAIENVAVQEICPLNTSEHLALGTTDPVAWALLVDALAHSGPARASRIPRSVCSQAFMPGVDPLTFPTDLAAAAAALATTTATYPSTGAEPPLRDYVFER